MEEASSTFKVNQGMISRYDKTLLFIKKHIPEGKTVLDLGVFSLVALILNYLFEAIMFPTIFTLAIRGSVLKQKVRHHC